jgi:hypothetical protein
MKMIFQRRLTAISLSVFLLLLYCFYIIKTHSFHVNTLILILYLASVVAILSTYLKVENGKISKYVVFIKTSEISINDVQIIEAITSKQFGQIIIKIGESPTEDYYKLLMKDNTSFTVDCYYMKNGQTMGRYLNKEYSIPLKEKEKITFFNNGI